MNEFDLILEECVDLIASGESSLEECLSNYPEYAAQLEPILITVSCLQEEGRDVIPPPTLRARIRRELNQAMKNKPNEDHSQQDSTHRGPGDFFSGVAGGTVLKMPVCQSIS
jgi:hypothetical protein